MEVALCCGLSAGFVAACYAVPPKIRKLPRDDPSHILRRSLALSVYTVVCFFGLQYIQASREWNLPQASSAPLIAWLGVLTDNAMYRVFAALELTVCLFIGPVAADVLEFVFAPTPQMRLHVLSSRFQVSGHWTIALRNLVVAPITEEFVFRGCILSLLLWSGVSPTKAILVAPVFFGFAHAHHGIRQVREGVSLNVAVLSTIVQFAYTTLFGIYVGYLFLRTGSLWAVIVVHSFCNAMGFPTFPWTDSYHPLYRLRILLNVLMIAGLSLFLWRLQSATDPSLFGPLYPGIQPYQ